MVQQQAAGGVVDDDDEIEWFCRRCILVNGPVIVGAGPSGLAVGAGLRKQGVPFVMLERAGCIASLWQNKTYDRLKLHLPKQFCQLPFFPFPPDFPEYPSKHQFLDYLESYAKEFDINPRFNQSVQHAKYDETCGLWRVRTVVDVEYISRWLVVATGENAEKVVPEFEGLEDEFGDGENNKVIHACDYRSGEDYKGKKVLVVGCGNSGMEVSLDLCHHHAFPTMVVRSTVHVLPREIGGKSTFEIASWLMKWGVPVKMADRILLILARCKLGNLERYGIKRPLVGPMELKNTRGGKTPVLDMGTLQKIKSGKIQIVTSGINKFSRGGVDFVNGVHLEIDAVILATGYCTNVPSWLINKESEMLYSSNNKEGGEEEEGLIPALEQRQGRKGLYAVGFRRRGLSGASFDAIRVSQDIAHLWNQQTNPPPRPHHILCCHTHTTSMPSSSNISSSSSSSSSS